jgi:hypothetical protein
MGMEERLLLDGIALHSRDVAPGNVKRAAAVVADFADAGLAFGNGAAVAAGETSNTVVVEFFVEGRIGFADPLVQDITQGGHKNL